MKRKDVIDSNALHFTSSKDCDLIETELQTIFGFYGFETSFRFVDVYDY